ncbi:hypothetical protein LTR62_001072 [Meristemomyces frigidus]|uniref:PPM-type phosphatase domain-containing protein n=1 Tax=Meristemomyces frigidus TaxID=1508187 RepID=A0AAN7YMJ4_9PEZI|nr:hypothetical protein LTR62_001072 [Meristemomyces frigidus]
MMLSTLLPQALQRSCRTLVHRTSRYNRRQNGSLNSTPHITYFQPPPEPPKAKRRILRNVFLYTALVGAGAYAHAWLLDIPFLSLGLETLEEDVGALQDAMQEALHAAAAKGAPPMDLERSQEMLESRAGYSVTQTAVAHTAQLASNLPCEDQWSSGAFDVYHDPKKDWVEWAVFDGHAGPRTAMLLKEWLPGTVASTMWAEKCFGRKYVPNDSHIIKVIKQIFVQVDEDICNTALRHIQNGLPDRAAVVAAASVAFSGSCALLALYDPANHVLRVANTGDSRAVLGRWDGAQSKYIAQPLSTDQTGFNKDEVSRINAQHPGEDVVDPATGRIHGLAVSRAFGDARWKWPQEVNRRAQEWFWGPKPRSDSMIKTPPYLTAEPEIMESKISTGERPDFLIMASDGLWDQMSNEDAVTCVQMWLDKNKPTNFLEKLEEAPSSSMNQLATSGQKSQGAHPGLYEKRDSGFANVSDLDGEDEDVYYDKDEQTLKWRVSPKHFIVEDENCGIHMIKNALGGRRRDLFTGVMSVQPPLSRNVRDDITVHVIFFGQSVDTPVIGSKQKA